LPRDVQDREAGARDSLPVIDSIVVFKWKKPGYRSKFDASTVNYSYRATNRYYERPHRFICVTDDPTGLDPGIEVVPMWDDFFKVKNPSWKDGPNAYPRLKIFSDWFGGIAGERFAMLDLDIVFTGDLAPIFDKPGDFLMWRTNHHEHIHCASIMVIESGKHRRVWDDFDPVESPKRAKDAEYHGSDQGWIRYCFRDKNDGWGSEDGIYGYQDPPFRDKPHVLPKNARAVVFTGKPDPWEPAALIRSPWIREYYR
jgi:hypothetical protein